VKLIRLHRQRLLDTALTEAETFGDSHHELSDVSDPGLILEEHLLDLDEVKDLCEIVLINGVAALNDDLERVHELALLLVNPRPWWIVPLLLLLLDSDRLKPVFKVVKHPVVDSDVPLVRLHALGLDLCQLSLHVVLVEELAVVAVSLHWLLSRGTAIRQWLVAPDDAKLVLHEDGSIVLNTLQDLKESLVVPLLLPLYALVGL